MNQERIFDQPRSAGVQNMLKRARQLYGLAWAPEMQYGINQFNSGYLYPMRDGRVHEYPQCYVGMPYSSTRVLDRFIGLDIPFDTFFSALRNPISVLYTRDLSDFDDPAFHCMVRNTFLIYGAVCSSFVSYSLGLPVHRSTHEWENLTDMDELSRDVNALALGDALVTTREDGHTGGHIRIVTGIERWEDGSVKMVEISEGFEPTPNCRWYPSEEVQKTFLGSGGNYRAFRYQYLDQVAPPEAIHAVESYDLMPDCGDQASYSVGETVTFHINCAMDELVLEGEENRIAVPADSFETVKSWNRTFSVCRCDALPADCYTVYGVKDGVRTRSVQIAVVKTSELKLTHADGTPFERVAFRPVAADGSKLCRESACFYDSAGRLTENTVTVAVTDGERRIPVHAAVQEKNGVLFLRMAPIFTDETGAEIRAFPVESDTVLYAYRVEENAAVKVEFSGAENCRPFCLSWKEEAAIAYDQRVLTEEEKNSGQTMSRVYRHNNAFAQAVLLNKSAFGTVLSKSVSFVLI